MFVVVLIHVLFTVVMHPEMISRSPRRYATGPCAPIFTRSKPVHSGRSCTGDDDDWLENAILAD